MFFPSCTIPSFTNCFKYQEELNETTEEKLNEASYDKQKVAWISGIAITCLAIATWNLMKNNPFAALVVSIGGVCLEIALLILWPSQSPSKVSDASKKTEDLDAEEPVELDLVEGEAATEDASKDVSKEKRYE